MSTTSSPISTLTASVELRRPRMAMSARSSRSKPPMWTLYRAKRDGRNRIVTAQGRWRLECKHRTPGASGPSVQPDHRMHPPPQPVARGIERHPRKAGQRHHVRAIDELVDRSRKPAIDEYRPRQQSCCSGCRSCLHGRIPPASRHRDRRTPAAACLRSCTSTRAPGTVPADVRPVRAVPGTRLRNM